MATVVSSFWAVGVAVVVGIWRILGKGVFVGFVVAPFAASEVVFVPSVGLPVGVIVGVAIAVGVEAIVGTVGDAGTDSIVGVTVSLVAELAVGAEIGTRV